jgi:hypothetical protein
MSGKLKFSEGNIELMGRPVCIFPVSFLREVCLQASTNPDFLYNVYLEAWDAGLQYCHNMNQHYKLKAFEDRYSLSMKIIAMAGFGDYNTHTFEKGKFTHFKINNNPLAMSCYPMKKAIDHVLRGFNAGGGAAVHLKITNCIEPECIAVNGKFCEFVNGTSKYIKKVNNELVEEQLPRLDEMVKHQKKIVKVLKGPKFKV